MEVSFVIKSSQTKILQENIGDICKLYGVKVELQVDPNLEDGEIQWVLINGGDDNERNGAKTYIIALCDPEIKERVSFLGFPAFIFKAFDERCKHKVEKDCGVVLSVSDDGWVDVQGTNIGVTLATSKIHQLNKLHKEKNTEKLLDVARKFNCYVEPLPQKEELLKLSNSLKKEILEMLSVPFETKPKEPWILVDEEAKSPIQETGPPAQEAAGPSSSPEIIEINDTVNTSTITISSGTEDSSDDSDTEPKLVADGAENTDIRYILPPTFVIKEWLKIHYEGMNDPVHYVLKTDMLQHFKGHFDLPDHPELSNTFFDKLAVRIFPQDPSYRSVKTKKTKNKHSRRRLVCLRRKTVSESDKEEVPAENPGPVQQSVNTVISDWNANRTTQKEIKMDTLPPRKIPAVSTVQSTKPPSPHKPVPFLPPPPQPPYQLMNQIRPPAQRGLSIWLNSERQRQPPTPQVLPQARPRESKSIESRVSRMSDEQLIHAPRPPSDPSLRPVVIDGSNVAMSHGNGINFSCRGIAICARVFMERGHGDITCFVPNYRKGGGGNPPSRDPRILMELEKIGILKCTPSRRVRGKNQVCYDDRFIVELAEANGGVILSNDQYRDLMMQNHRWRPIVEERLLQYTMVNDLLMLPEDPLGRNGPPLAGFLKIPNNRPNAPQQRMWPRSVVPPGPAHALPKPYPTMPVQKPRTGSPRQKQNWPLLTEDDKKRLVADMLKVLPGREKDIQRVVNEHPRESRIDRLMNFLFIGETGS